MIHPLIIHLVELPTSPQRDLCARRTLRDTAAKINQPPFLALLLTVLLQGLAVPCPAQHIIKLGSVQLNGRGWSPDHAAHAIVVDSVILSTPALAPVGIAQLGLDSHSGPVYLDAPIDKALLDLYGRLRTAERDGPHIVVKIQRLWVTEQLYQTHETVSCAFAAEVLQREGAEWRKRYDFGTVVHLPGGLDATEQLGEAVARAADQLLRRTAWAFHHRVVRNVPIDDPGTSRLPNIPQAKVDGLYLTYADRLDGTPDTLTPYTVEDVSLPGAIAREFEVDGGDSAEDAWGFCANGRTYIRLGRSFTELLPDSAGFFTFGMPRAEITGQAAMNGAMFGLVGVALSGPGQPRAVPMRLDLDPCTGGLQRHRKPMPTELSDTYIIYYSRSAKVDERLCLWSDGVSGACLQRGQYHVLRVPTFRNGKELELRTASGAVKVTLPSAMDRDQVVLVNVKENGEIRSDVVNEAMANELQKKFNPENRVE